MRSTDTGRGRGAGLFRLPALLLAAVFTAACLTCCSGSGSGGDGTSAVSGPETSEAAAPEADLVIAENGSISVNVVRGFSATDAEISAAKTVREYLLGLFPGGDVRISDDYSADGTYRPDDVEILIGNTSYPQTAQVKESLPYGDYTVCVRGNKLVAAVWAPVALPLLAQRLCDMLGKSLSSDGRSLTVRGIRFSGRLTPGRSLAKGIISTDDNMVEPYTLTVEECSFSDCGESGFVPIRGLKGTFAESVTVRGCSFEALSGDAINYAAETEDKGRYNADDILIEGCSFKRILGIPVQIARNGSDESTAGPYVTVRGCTFDDCCNKVRGSVLRIIGAQVLDISGNTFSGSGRGGYSIRLDEAPWEKITVRGNTFHDSGKILSNRAL